MADGRSDRSEYHRAGEKLSAVTVQAVQEKNGKSTKEKNE